MSHWFKYARATDLSQIKIYEAVRGQIDYNFRRHFMALASGLAKTNKTTMITIVPLANNSSKMEVWFC